MTFATYNSGAPALQVQELFYESGVICPSKRGQRKMMERLKESITNVSEEQFRNNRKKHIAAVRKQTNYKGDFKFTDQFGKDHSIAIGPAAVDGNGDKRAYSHIITGEQHIRAIISLVIDKILAIWHDQISCVHCQHKLTELLNMPSNRRRATDISAKDLTHPGKKCYRNSNNSPGTAEEWTCESLAEYLLIDPDTGKL